ncbi:DNA polymerase III subunit gamma and tau [Schaalia sp. ZJ1691]|uniref:DNA polymerase III subunit gamma and tau n=1 Tax=Schaalia sp. ZJ1691 TaxID=2709404 RepID=UPI0013EA2D39|nr:DNA polymerase III subunit gamma and tau [Schaalia sp. ZJ1691]
MSTALYRRYRPDTFDQVIGQDHVTQPLRAALSANRVTHAYLFSGPRGCGKTTSARILARCLNCAQGPTDTPCGTCESCVELANGGPGSLDVVEIDAASHGGVDDARELRERAAFAPIRDRYKIFIIDEAHMVTNQGFNALLKIVEEPPEHVKFVFATTEPDRVIGTIRSRTHHYPFRLVPPDVLAPYLQELCEKEQIAVDQGVINLVMRAGGGSVRDTLSVLDQLMAGVSDGHLTYHTAIALLGYTDTELLDETVDALAGGDGAAAFRVVERMVDSGHEPRRFAEDFLQRLRDLLIVSVAGDGAADVLSGVPVDQFERMQRQAKNWGSRALSRAADLTDEALRTMAGATSPRLQLELLIGRILVPLGGAQVGHVNAQGVAQGGVPGGVGIHGGGAPNERDQARFAGGGQSGGRGPRGLEALAAYQQSQGQNRPASSPQSVVSEAAPAQTVSSAPVAEGMSAPAPAPAQPQNFTPASTPTRGSEPADSAFHNRENSASRQGEAPSDSRREQPRQPVQSAPAEANAWADVQPRTPGSQDGHDDAPPSQPASGRIQNSSASSPQSEQLEQPGTQSTHPDSQREANTGEGQPIPADSQTEAGHTPGTGRDADMLRNRWGEVVERLSSMNRVTWTQVSGNGQLGAVDGSTVVILFPSQGFVAQFMSRGRFQDVERAIQDVLGLNVSVTAQVGQAAGGPAVSAPTADASRDQTKTGPRHEFHTGPRTDDQGWVSEPPPFEKASAEAHSEESEPHEQFQRANADVSEELTAHDTAQVSARDELSADTDHVATDSASVPATSIPSPTSKESSGDEDDAPYSSPVQDVSAASTTVESPPAEPQAAESSQDPSEPFHYPEPGETPRDTRGEKKPASSSSMRYAPEPDVARQAMSSWEEAVAIPGGEGRVVFDEADSPAVSNQHTSPHGRAESEQPPAPEHQLTSEHQSAPEQQGSPEEQPTPDRRAVIAEVQAQMRERTQHAPQEAQETQVIDDDTASFDDEDLETSTNFGLSAVLDILGGKVVEEVYDEGKN